MHFPFSKMAASLLAFQTSMKKILVVNLRFFGDALISAALSVRLKTHWPNAEVTYLVFDRVAPILEGIKTIDRILAVPQRPPKRKQLAFMLKHFHEFDIALVTQTGTRPTLYGSFLGKTSVGFDVPWSTDDWWKHLLIKKMVQPRNAAVVLSQNELLDAIGCPPSENCTVPQPHGKLPLEALLDAPYVVIHPTPSCTYKEWPVGHWQTLITEINRRGCRVALTGSGAPHESDYVQSVIPADANAISLAGKLSFAQTAELIARSCGYVGPDTGTTHVAAATGVPVVTLFGPSGAAYWGPWAPKQSVPYSDNKNQDRQRRGNVILIQKHPYERCTCCGKGCQNRDDSPSDCLKAITPEEVLQSLSELGAFSTAR